MTRGGRGTPHGTSRRRTAAIPRAEMELPGASSPSLALPVELTATELTMFRELIYERTGIAMSESKKALLEGRLARRLRELGLPRFFDYYRLVKSSPEELQHMLDKVTTHETRFFRGPWPFAYLDGVAFPAWRERAADFRQRQLRAWSAACSTGEEAYSLAMHLLDQFPTAGGWRVEIVATDISTEVLERAEEGVYSLARSDVIPPEYLKRFMLKGTGGQAGRMRAGQELRSIVSFRSLNLDGEWPAELGTFDLIFCRNVLIYFDAESRRRAIGRLLDRLVPSGLLVVGHAESLAGLDPRTRYLAPTVYGFADAAARVGATTHVR